MPNVEPILLVDAGIVLILLIYVLAGIRRGMVRRISGLCALVLGVLGGQFLRDRFAEAVNARWVQPAIARALEYARASQGLKDIAQDLAAIVEGAKLPAFLKAGVAEQVLTEAGSGLEAALNSFIGQATAVISLEFSRILLFLVGGILIALLVRLLFNGLIEPIFARIHILNALNRTLGAVLGGVLGVCVAGLLLLLARQFFPHLSAPGGLFSQASLDASYVTGGFFRFFASF